jgi:hemolysin activation/secretion protein
MRPDQKLAVIGGLAGAILTSATGTSRAQAVPPVPNPGIIADQNRRNQETIQRRDETSLNGPAVIGPKPAETLVGPPGGASFVLKRVTFDPTAFISTAELDAIAARYVGRKVDNSDLQRIVKAVNDILAERRVITALAYLPAQDLKGGVLRVAIVEGKLGKAVITGTDRLPAQTVAPIAGTPGAVVDTPKLESDVARFNRTHNAQVQASLQPGASFGLTDIQLAVIEPPRNSLQVFGDNMGVESVGRVQGGINFQHYGLIGLDDRFTLYSAVSEGNLTGNAAYNAAVTPWGTRLGVSGSRGTIRVVSGPYRPLGITGSSTTGALNASQPVFVNTNWALLVSGSLSSTQASSWQQDVSITDNTTLKRTIGASLSYTSTDFSATIAPNYSFARTHFGVTGVAQEFEVAAATYSATARLPEKFVLSINGAAQRADQKLLAGDQLFQIGGPTTVRGYSTTGAAGYAGYYVNVELHHEVPFIEGLDGFVFYDRGQVYSTFPATVTMDSLGAGLSWDSKRNLIADVSIGVPITKSVDQQPKYTAYFRVTAKFP